LDLIPLSISGAVIPIVNHGGIIGSSLVVPAPPPETSYQLSDTAGTPLNTNSGMNSKKFSFGAFTIGEDDVSAISMGIKFYGDTSGTDMVGALYTRSGDNYTQIATTDCPMGQDDTIDAFQDFNFTSNPTLSASTTYYGGFGFYASSGSAQVWSYSSDKTSQSNSDPTSCSSDISSISATGGNKEKQPSWDFRLGTQ